jgi:dihydrodipicolinate synthase/N-acetylneuraminate lyase
MITQTITPELLTKSVISVPPLARSEHGQISLSENRKIIEHLYKGGVRTFLYGGNAVLYHLSMKEFEVLLEMMMQLDADDCLMIPSVGPFFGTMMDQAKILRKYEFPTVMILPTRDMTTSIGIANGIRRFVDYLGKPVVLYIKNEDFIETIEVKKLMEEGVLSFIKYALVRKNPIDDPFLKELVQNLGSARIVSGMGEQPVFAHKKGFNLNSYTSGCVCIAPGLSMEMLQALQKNDLDLVETIRKKFELLEGLRNAINPVRVLHAAIKLTKLADTGPLQPMMSEISDSQAAKVAKAAMDLLKNEEKGSDS